MKKPETKSYRALKRQYLKGQWLDVGGDPVELTDQEARFRLRSGAIELAGNSEAAKPSKPAPKSREAKAD